MWWVVGIIVAFIVARLLKGNPQKPLVQFNEHVLDTRGLTEDQKYYIGYKVIGLSARKGYIKTDIVGVYYRHLPLTMLGRFNGYAEAQHNNEYDLYAIAIYNDNGTHLGFLEGGNKRLHSYITNEGSRVHAYGYIGCTHGDSMYGQVCVEVNKELVTKRNKYYGDEQDGKPALSSNAKTVNEMYKRPSK